MPHIHVLREAVVIWGREKLHLVVIELDILQAAFKRASPGLQVFLVGEPTHVNLKIDSKKSDGQLSQFFFSVQQARPSEAFVEGERHEVPGAIGQISRRSHRSGRRCFDLELPLLQVHRKENIASIADLEDEATGLPCPDKKGEVKVGPEAVGNLEGDKA